jgi:anti-sigma factor RsiW
MVCPRKVNKNAEILMDYCAKTLDPAQALEFEKHLEECADCRGVVEAQREVWEILDRWKPAPVSANFDARLHARIAREETAPQWRRWWWRVMHPAEPFSVWKPAVSLAAICAVLAVGLYVRVPGPSATDKQLTTERVDIEQVEKTLEDLDILTPAI